MRTKRLRTYAASGLVLAAWGPGLMALLPSVRVLMRRPTEPPLLWRLQPPLARLRPLRPPFRRI